jgi:hypothetical protein
MTINGPVTNPPPQAAVPGATAPARPARRSDDGRFGSGAGRRAVFALAAVAVAWLVALGAHLARLDALTLVLVVAGTGLHLRGAGSPLDRLVLALGLLGGLTCAGALALSLWPGHLRPQLLGGLALTGLVVLSAVRGGLPGLPRRQDSTGRQYLTGRRWRADLAVLVPAGVIGYLFARPTLDASLPVRLGTVIRGEDLARHFAMFDTIRRVGGYAFLHRSAASGSIAPSDLAYPQGAHLLAAVVENFLTSSAGAGSPIAAMSHFLYYDELNYLFLALAVLWSARRLAGPGIRALAFLPVAGLCVGYLLFGSLITMYTYGFFAEIAGLAFLALLTGVLVRPLPDTREQVLVVAAVVVAIGYCYYILLPVAAVAVLAYAVVYRRRLLGRPVLVGAVALGGGAACLVLRVAAGDEQALSLGLLVQDFGVVRVQRGPVLALAVLVVFGVAAIRPWWRAPAARIAAVGTAGAAALACGVGLYERDEVGRTLYFFEKSMHTVIVLLLITSGAAAAVVQRLLDALALRTRAGLAAGALALALLPVTALGGLDWDPQQQAGAEFHDPAYGTSPGRLLTDGQLPVVQPAAAAIAAARAVPDPGGRITLIATNRQTDNLATFYAWMLQRDYGRTWWVYPKTFTMRSAWDYQTYIQSQPAQRFRVLSDNRGILDALRDLAARRPDLGLEVDNLPGLRGQ